MDPLCSTILNSSGQKLWDTFHNLYSYYANVWAVFSQQLLWLRMRNWCQMKALFSSFNAISHTYLNDLYFAKYIHRKASRWAGWIVGFQWAKPVRLICACAAVRLTQFQDTSFKFVWFFYIFTTFAGKNTGFSCWYAYFYSQQRYLLHLIEFRNRSRPL